MPISVKRIDKNRLDLGQESVGDASVLSHYSLIRNPWPKPTRVLKHCREGETNCCFFPFFGLFLLTAYLRRRRMPMYISMYILKLVILSTQRACLTWEYISVFIVYLKQWFLSIIPANSGNFLKLVRMYKGLITFIWMTTRIFGNHHSFIHALCVKGTVSTVKVTERRILT